MYPSGLPTDPFRNRGNGSGIAFRLLRNFRFRICQLLILFGILFLPFSVSTFAQDGQSEALSVYGNVLSQEEAIQDSLDELYAKSLPADSLVTALNDFVVRFRNQSHRVALKAAEEALFISESNNFTDKIRISHQRLGELYTNYLQDYDNGLIHLNTALRLSREANDQETLYSAYALLGYLHGRMENFKKSREAYDQGIAIARESGNRDAEQRLLGSAGYMLIDADQPEEARKYFRQVYDMEKAAGFVDVSPWTRVNIGKLYELEGDEDNAIQQYQAAVEDFSKTENWRWAAWVWSVIAEMEYKRGRPEKALQSAYNGLNMAQKFNLKKEIADNHFALYWLNDSLGNAAEALKHFRAYTTLDQEMFSLEKARQIAHIQAGHELDMKQKDLERVQNENNLKLRKSRLITTLSLTVAGLLITVLVFLFRGYRQKLRINRQFADRVEMKDLALSEIVAKLKQEVDDHRQTQAMLEKTNGELYNFIYKSSHDFRGPVSSILGLVALSGKSRDESELKEFARLIGISGQRLDRKLNALSQASQLIGGEIRMQPIRLAAHVVQIHRRMQNQEYAKGIEIKLDIPEDFQLHSDPELLDIMLFHVIQNGMLFKNDAEEHPWIKVTARQSGRKSILEISDNGQGIEQRLQEKIFDMFSRSENKYFTDGLGLYLVKKAVEKLKGTVQLQSEIGKGTVVRIELPDKA